MSLQSDLRSFPARLYAILPAPVGAPRVSVGVMGETLQCRVDAVDSNGAALPARIPIRVRLASGNQVALDCHRGTDAGGRFEMAMPLPVNSTRWTLEVTELIGNMASALEISNTVALATAITKPGRF